MGLSDLFRLAAGYRVWLIALVILKVLSSAVLLAVPSLAGRMVGGIMIARSGSGRLIAVLLAALALIAALNVMTLLLSTAIAARMLADLRVRMYGHLQALPISFHHDRRQGDLLALATFEVARLGQFLTGTLVTLPARLLTAAGAAVLMFRINPHLALLVPSLVPAFYLILKIVGRRLRGLAVAAQRAEADVIAAVEKNLAMIPAIKSFAREAYEMRDYRGRAEHAMRLSIQQGRINAVLEPLVGLIAGSAAVLLLFSAGKNMRDGAMTSVELFSFLFYAALLTRPVGALAQIYGDFQAARGTLARLHSVLAEGPEQGYASDGGLAAARGHLSFRGVAFGYPGRPRILDDVTLEIEAGEKVAMIGDNGAGKTTLMNLLLRFVDLNGGSIWLDGQDITTLQIQDLRRQIGVVPQHAMLFNGTIRDNIAYGLEGATDDQVTNAARLSQALDFILALPDGLDTQIGDHGVLLSGGQRQRLSLARALVKDPPILLLDEVTSMFDVEGELAFIAACAGALEGRTVLFTTHRAASLAIADRIIKVEGGSVHAIDGASDIAAPSVS